jgi:hypothetical protein
MLYEAGSENVSLLPYNPMGIEMAVSLGRPRPPLPKAFMAPNEEKEICTMFQMILEEKREKVRSDGQCEAWKLVC